MKLIDQLTESQRFILLQELLESPTNDELSLINDHVNRQIKLSVSDNESEEMQRKIAQQIAEKRNNQSLSDGVIAKKLI